MSRYVKKYDRKEGKEASGFHLASTHPIVDKTKQTDFIIDLTEVKQALKTFNFMDAKLIDNGFSVNIFPFVSAVVFQKSSVLFPYKIKATIFYWLTI